MILLPWLAYRGILGMANDENYERVLEELSLMLLYLTRFREKEWEMWRSWKGYDFGVLDNLQKNEFISFSYKAKSVYFEEKGLEKARELLQKYGIEVDDEMG